MQNFTTLPFCEKITDQQKLDMYRHIIDLQEDLETIYSAQDTYVGNWKDPHICISDPIKDEDLVTIRYGFMDDEPAFEICFDCTTPASYRYVFANEISSKDLVHEIFQVICGCQIADLDLDTPCEGAGNYDEEVYGEVL